MYSAKNNIFFILYLQLKKHLSTTKLSVIFATSEVLGECPMFSVHFLGEGRGDFQTNYYNEVYTSMILYHIYRGGGICPLAITASQFTLPPPLKQSLRSLSVSVAAGPTVGSLVISNTGRSNALTTWYGQPLENETIHDAPHDGYLSST